MLCRDCERPARKKGYCLLHSPRKCKCGSICAGECTFCREKSEQQKVYEHQMKNTLCFHGIDDFIHNKRVIGTLYSPDFLWQREAWYVILEVDEYGHRSYSAEKEMQRMCALSIALKKPVVFVRISMPCPDADLQGCISSLQQVLDSMDVPSSTSSVNVMQFFAGKKLQP